MKYQCCIIGKDEVSMVSNILATTTKILKMTNNSSNSNIFSFNSSILHRSSSIKNEALLVDNLSRVIPTLNDRVRNVLANGYIATRKVRSQTTNIPLIEITPPTPLSPTLNDKSSIGNAVENISCVFNTYCTKLRRFSAPDRILSEHAAVLNHRQERRVSVPLPSKQKHLLQVPKNSGKRRNKKRKHPQHILKHKHLEKLDSAHDSPKKKPMAVNDNVVNVVNTEMFHVNYRDINNNNESSIMDIIVDSDVRENQNTKLSPTCDFVNNINKKDGYHNNEKLGKLPLDFSYVKFSKRFEEITKGIEKLSTSSIESCLTKGRELEEISSSAVKYIQTLSIRN